MSPRPRRLARGPLPGAARLAGERTLAALLYALAIAAVGAFLIALKALVH